MMKKFFISFSISALPFFTFAQEYTGTKLSNPVARITEPGNLIDIIVAIVQFLGGPIVVIGLIYAGYTLVAAQGDPAELEKGRHALLWVIVGAAVILGATVIKSIVAGTLTEVFGGSV